MFLSRVALRQVVAILALSLFASADSIPYQDSGSKPSDPFSRLYSVSIPSIRLLLDSALAQQAPSGQPQKGVFLVYGAHVGGDTSVRNMNVLEWLVTAIGKLVLPSHGKAKTRKY